MKKKVIRLTESDIEKLVKKIITEKSVSQDQQQAAGIALSAKRGEIPVSELRGSAKEMYDSMTEKELKDFASTKHKGLPVKVDEAGGYDSFELGSSHSQSTMESIRDAYEVMSDTVEHLNTLKLDILDDKLSMATRRLVFKVGEALDEYSKYWTEAEKRRIGRFR